MVINKKTLSDDELRKNNLEDAEYIVSDAIKEIITNFEAEATKNSKNKEVELNKQLEKVEIDKDELYKSCFIFDDGYYQSNKQIFRVISTVKGEKIHFITNLSINRLELVYDCLNPNQPFFNIEYYNGLREKLISKEKLTKKELINEFKDSCCFIDESKSIVEKVTGKIIHSLKEKEIMNIKYELLKEGYFLEFKENGTIKLLENTLIKDLKINTEEVKEALLLVNEFLESRPKAIKQNSEIFRFMLSSPFHYCIKQLSLANNNTKGHLAWRTTNQ